MAVRVIQERCAWCGCCVGICPVGALCLDETRLRVDDHCTDCGLCLQACPTAALTLGHRQYLTDRPYQSGYDVVVIGAGPGGSMAAKAAARAGAKVLLVEKRQEIGSPVRCAEGVNETALVEMVSPSPHWIAATVTRAVFQLLEGAPELRMRGEGGTGFILERRIFDRFLAEEAASAGADIRVKTSAIDLTREGARVTGVRLRHGNNTEDVSARVIIGADGVESWVGRWSGLVDPIPLNDQMTCAQVLLAGLRIDPTCLRYWLSGRFAPGGYIWLFPKGEDKANVGLGIQADLVQETPIALLYRFIESMPELSPGRVVTLMTGGVPLAPAPKDLVGDGIMLVGDAARQVDPLTGGGIIPAMRAGLLAGTIAAEALGNGSVDARSLHGYQEEWQATTGKTLARNYRLRQRYPPGDRINRSFMRVFAVAAGG